MGQLQSCCHQTALTTSDETPIVAEVPIITLPGINLAGFASGYGSKETFLTKQIQKSGIDTRTQTLTQLENITNLKKMWLREKRVRDAIIEKMIDLQTAKMTSS